MISKDVLILVLKCIVAIATAILGILGVASVSSCSASRNVTSLGVTRIVTTDTTVVNHSGCYNLKLSR